jgi:hypothetical protein
VPRKRALFWLAATTAVALATVACTLQTRNSANEPVAPPLHDRDNDNNVDYACRALFATLLPLRTTRNIQASKRPPKN